MPTAKTLNPFSLALCLLCGAAAGKLHGYGLHTDLGSNRLIGIFDFELAYGVRWRLDERSPDLISRGNGGEGDNGNFDDGNLNYDPGKPVSNMVRGAAELTLVWGNFGAFARGYAFYDFENENRDRARTELGSGALEQVGSDVRLREAYLSARFEVGSMPLQFRLGQQIVNWGESRFFPLSGINVANPLDLPLFQQPVALPKDLRLPVGTLWGSLQFNPFLAVEAYYQYEWHETILPASGTYLSATDPMGPDGITFQAGPFPDQGTNVDAVFGLPPGTIGFDPDFWQVPHGEDDKPGDQGQYGISLSWLAENLNDTKFVFSFANYHSKIPYLSGITPSLETYLAYTIQNIAVQTERLIEAGTDPMRAATAAQTVLLGQVFNDSEYILAYPENIRVLGLSFNTSSLRTGTAFYGEFSYHFDSPVPIFPNQVFDQVLPESVPEDPFPPSDLEKTSPEELAANYANKRQNFTDELDRSFLSLGATQLFGPRLGAAQSALTAEIGWSYIRDMPSKDELLYSAPGLILTTISPASLFPDSSSWGYRLRTSLTYNNVFGALTLRPRLSFSHDVRGISPSGAGPFYEGRKAFGIGLAASFLESATADMSYVRYSGGGKYNTLNDRDYLNLNIRYFF